MSAVELSFGQLTDALSKLSPSEKLDLATQSGLRI